MLFRKARVNDKERILEISKDVWEGNDYIPQVVDHWLSEDKGEFTVLEVDDEIRAFAKYTLVSETEVWLEGIRVASEYRTMGYAHAFTNHYIEKGKKENMSSLMFSTYYLNHGSIRSAQKHGFVKEAEFTILEMEEATLSGPIFQGHLVTDAQKAWDIICNSDEYKLSKGFYSEGWKFYGLTPESLSSLCKDNRVISDGDDSILIINPIQGTPTQISFYCGDYSRILGMLNYLYKNFPKGSQDVMLIEGSKLNGAFYEVGYKLWSNNDTPNVYLFKHPISI